jgi:hypothetical protein
MSDSPSLPITIHVKVLSGGSHAVSVNALAPISELQVQLASLAALPVPRQRLIFHGRVLQADKTLQSYSVSDGAVLHLVARPDPSASAPLSSTSSSSLSSSASASLSSSSSPSAPFVRVVQLPLTDGVSLANSVLSALGITTTTAPAAPVAAVPTESATLLLDQLDAATQDLLVAGAVDRVGAPTCERAAAQLERLAAQLRRGEICNVRLQRVRALLARLEADAAPLSSASSDGAPQRAPSGATAGASVGGSLQDVLTAAVAQIGSSDVNLQSLSASFAPLLNQLTTAAAPALANANNLAQSFAAALNGSAAAAPVVAPTPVAAPVAAAASAESSEHLETLQSLLKLVFTTLGVSSLMQIQAGNWAPVQAAHPQLRAALLEQVGVSRPGDVTAAQVSAFARQCAAAMQHVAMRREDAPADVLACFAPGHDAFGVVERETETHVDMFAHLLLKEWTPSAAQASPFGDAVQRWSNMYVAALVAGVRAAVRDGSNDNVATVLRHVCQRTFMASIPAPTATMLTNMIMTHVSRAHLGVQPKAVPIAAPARALRPISTVGLDMFPAEWRETIARDSQINVPTQGSLSELYLEGTSKKRRAFDERLAAALDSAGVDGVRAKRVLGNVPAELKRQFDSDDDDD